MPTRVAVALLVGLGLFGGGGAGAQTTTSSTSSSTTSSSTTSSTSVATTTSTTLVHPCTGQPCTAEPPHAVLSTSSAQITADRGSYCWREATGDSTRCVVLGAPPAGYKPPLLVVTQGEVVTVRFTAPVPLRPVAVALARQATLVPLPGTNPTSFRVDREPGIHDNGLITLWLQGQVPYFFQLDVRAAAPPATPVGRRQLTLTG